MDNKQKKGTLTTEQTTPFESLKQVNDFFKKRTSLGIKPGLERMYSLLNKLDNPHRRMKAVHVAGTNGKGSTVAFLKSVVMEAGYRAGTFTSPKKTELSDMIEINDEPIPDPAFLNRFNQLLPAIETLDQQNNSPSEFEILTAIALDYLYENADISIVETGMGGLEDTTNVLFPLLSIITTIGLDHRHFLGDTTEEVAVHKAGIIKAHTPVVIGRVPQETRSTFIEKASESKAAIVWLEEKAKIMEHRTEKMQEIIKVMVQGRAYHLRLKMPGKHQIDNASLAILAIEYLRKNHLTIDDKHIKAGIHKAFFPGRFEIISASPTIILDSAHNKEGIQAFITTVERFFANQHKHLLFAAFQDKPLEEMISLVDNYFNQITFTGFDHQRAAEGALLYDLSNSRNKRTENWKQVIHSLAAEETLFITGSVEFIMRVRDYLINNRQV